MVTFSNAFALGRGTEDLPPGTYELIVEEECLQGLNFEAYRRTGTFLMVPGKGTRSGHTSMHTTTQKDLEHAIARDRALSATTQDSEAALSPLEDKT